MSSLFFLTCLTLKIGLGGGGGHYEKWPHKNSLENANAGWQYYCLLTKKVLCINLFSLMDALEKKFNICRGIFMHILKGTVSHNVLSSKLFYHSSPHFSDTKCWL